MNNSIAPLTTPHPQLISALSGAPFAALLVDAAGRIVFANQPLLTLFGYTAEELLFQPLEILVPEAMRAHHVVQREGRTAHFRARATGRELAVVGRLADGCQIPLEIRLQSNETESGRITVAFVTDCRPAQAGQLELERRNRSLRLIHDCHVILVRAHSTDELLSSLVHCMAKSGNYLQVGVGLSPINDDGFCLSVHAGWAGTAIHRGMAGAEPLARQAMADGLTLVADGRSENKDNRDDSGRSMPATIALPLQREQTILGCLCISSMADRPFLTDEIELLQELADELAFSLDALNSRRLRRNAESRLRLLERAVEASSNAIIITDAVAAEHPILYANPAFERMTGYMASEAIGHNGRFLLGNDLEQTALEEIRAALRGHHEAKALLRNYRKDGSLFWNELTVAPVRDEAGLVTHFVSVMNDFTERKLQEAQIERQARFDTLTGLPNRSSLFERITMATAASEHNKQTVAVVLIALDRFSLINDAYGHDAGDALLHAVGLRLIGALRDRDTVGRLGGDEFVVLLSRLTVDDAMVVIDKIRNVLNRPFELACGEVPVSASIGVSFSPRDGADAQTLICNADVAMQGAKTAGWNAVRYYAEDMNRRTGERLAMEFDLRRALERREFEIHYQPIIDVESGRIIEAEALLRWNRPQHGLVPPDSFIPLAEKSGLIVAIGQWVINEACRQLALWRGAGLPPISVAVNLSARQFGDQGLEAVVATALAEHNLVGSDLILEVTESLLMTHLDAVSETLLRLKQLGVQISLDDFGTGYSSLSYLKQLPLDTLKIDRSFVRDIGTDLNDAAIATTIISMARAMQLGVVAEGVENEEQMSHLREQGCQRVQGYLFSKPVPAAQFGRLIGQSPAC